MSVVLCKTRSHFPRHEAEALTPPPPSLVLHLYLPPPLFFFISTCFHPFHRDGSNYAKVEAADFYALRAGTGSFHEVCPPPSPPQKWRREEDFRVGRLRFSSFLLSFTSFRSCLGTKCALHKATIVYYWLDLNMWLFPCLISFHQFVCEFTLE